MRQRKGMDNMSRYRRMERERVSAGSILAALFLVAFIFSASVVLVLNFRWLYYLDITLLGIENETGMNAAQIRANYDALISYNALWFRGGLVFPTLPMSENAAVHFREVKRIFDLIQIIFAFSAIASLVSIIIMKRRGKRKYLRIAGALTLIIPVILGALAAVDWQHFFVAFHKIAFNNDYWLFDPSTDPIILQLPDMFFFHCAAVILLLVFGGGLICLLAGRKKQI